MSNKKLSVLETSYQTVTNARKNHFKAEWLKATGCSSDHFYKRLHKPQLFDFALWSHVFGTPIPENEIKADFMFEGRVVKYVEAIPQELIETVEERNYL